MIVAALAHWSYQQVDPLQVVLTVGMMLQQMEINCTRDKTLLRLRWVQQHRTG
jgi:hypothetical protein